MYRIISSPIVSTPTHRSKLLLHLLLSSILVLNPTITRAEPPAATQLPTGEQVVGGQASISRHHNTMTINQSTNRAAIDWQSFDIGRQATVNFNQPSTSSVSLNRVQGGNPSQIFGQLNANGQVFLSNPNGIYFAPGASIDVGGLVATTHSLSVDDFMAGKDHFTRNGATGSILNEGTLTAALGGYIALLAPEVRNDGVIIAELGTVALAAGEAYELTFDRDRHLTGLRVDPAAIHTLVENKQAVLAPGGLIILSAHATNQLHGSVVRHDGVLSASSLVNQGGRIMLEGDDISLGSRSSIAATGATGGGDILIGGDWQGQGDMRHATTVTMEHDAKIDASATANGEGGKVVLWSDVSNADSATAAHGEIVARGGENGGDGGNIETSGAKVDIDGLVINAGAAEGSGGQWLIDPFNWIIGATNASRIVTALNAGTSVTIDTVSTTGSNGTANNDGTADGGLSGLGNISIDNAIQKSAGGDATLTMNTANNVIVNADITSTTGALDVVLDADNDNGTGDGAGIVILSADITTNGGNLRFGTDRTATINSVSTKVGGDVYVNDATTLTTSGGDIEVSGEMIIGTASGLNINSGNGDVTFDGVLNSGNNYSFVAGVSGTGSWEQARSDARNGTGGGSATGDSYLVTITSRLENSIASSTTLSGASYRGVWIGASRDKDAGSSPADTNWKWADGPEAGQTFFVQGGAATGDYNNFGSGEPNGTGIGGEYVGQFFGSEAKWNDLRSVTYFSRGAGDQYNVEGFVRETNLADSPLTINAGTGSIQFASAVGASKRLGNVTMSAGNISFNDTVSISGNLGLTLDPTSTASITQTDSWSIGGTSNFTLGTNNLTLNNAANDFTGAVSITSANTVSLNDTNNITLDDSTISGSMNVSATDITLDTGASISKTAGGDATLTLKADRDLIINSGGSISSTSSNLDMVLWSNADNSGVYFNGVVNVSDTAGAIQINSGVSLLSNGGDITLGGGAGTTVPTGSAQATGLLTTTGIDLNNATVNSAGGNISLSGTSVHANDAAIGVYLRGGTTLNSGSGTIAIKGESQAFAGSTTGLRNGIRLDNASLTSSSTASNAIVLNGQEGYPITSVETSGGTNSDREGLALVNATITASGGVTFAADAQAYSGTTLITSGSSDSLSITSFENNNFWSDFIWGGSGTNFVGTNSIAGLTINDIANLGGLTIGKASNTANITVGSTTSVAGDVNIYGGNLAMNSPLTATGTNTISLTSSGTITDGASGYLVADKLALLGGNVTLDHASNNVGTLAASGVGPLSFTDSTALTIGSVTATGITATGAVDIATLMGNLTVSENISGTSIILNAAKNTAAGTATGGNLLLSGSPTITATTGNAQLYSGSIAGSTGLTSLINSGSGNFRYNSDEAAPNFTAALGATGNYAIYREQPTVTVTATSETVTYGTDPSATNLSGVQNGDTAGHIFSTAPTVAVGGSTSTSGNYTAGSHSLTPSGAVDQLGYAIASTNGTLTVNKKTITPSLAANNKVYDATTTATVDHASTTFTGRLAGDILTTATTAGAFANNTVGTGKTVTFSGTTYGGADVANYSFTDPTSTTANITAATLTLSGSTGIGKVYDGTTNLSAGQTGYGTLGGLLGSDVVTLAGAPVYSSQNVGAQTIQQGTVGLQGTDAGNYSLSWTNGNGSITPAPLTVRANPSAKFVTEADPAGFQGVSVEGLVNGETTSVLGGTAAITRSDNGDNTVGAHSGVLVPSGLTSTNYTLSFVNGNFTIVPAEQLLVEVANTPTSIFGTTPTFTVSGAKYLNSGNTIVDLTANVSATGNAITLTDGFGGSAAFTLTALNPQTSTGGHLEVGSYQVGSGTITESSGNFSDTVTFVGTHTVTPKTLTVATGQVSKTYDGTVAMPDLTLGLTGLANGDVATVTGTGTYATTQAGTGLSYTLSNLALAGADAANYVPAGGGSLSRTDGVITPKSLTRQALTATDRIYNGGTTATLANAGTLAGIIAGDTVTSDTSGATAVFDNKNVGTNKTVTVTGLGLGGADASNYTVSATDSTTAAITRLSSVTWTGGATGNWFDPANWAGGAVPDLANVEAVTIPTGVVVTFNDQSVVTPAQAGTVEINSLGTDGGLTIEQGTLEVGTGGVTLDQVAQTGGVLTSLGDITLGRFTQTSGSTSTQGDFTTTQEYDQTGTGTVTVAGNTTLTDTTGGLRLGNLSSTGPLVVTSTDGDITQANGTGLTAGSTSQFTARAGGQPADIVLTNTSNDFRGLVDLNGRNVSIVDGNGGLQVGTVNATGLLTLTGVDTVSIENSVLDTVGGVSSQTETTVVQPVGTPSSLPAMNTDVLTMPATSGSTGSPLPNAGPTPATLNSPRLNTTIIQEVAQPTPYGAGLITISLPRNQLQSSAVLVIEFPDSIKQTLSTFTGTFQLSNGQPLPTWLAYEADAGGFRLTNPPPNAFPLELKIKTGKQDLMVVFSEHSS